MHHDIGQQQRRGHVLGMADRGAPGPEAESPMRAVQRPAQAAARPTSTASASPGRRAIASTSTAWPFQRVSRPGSITTGAASGSARPGGSAAIRAGAHRRRVEAPRVDAARDDAEPRGVGAVAGAHVARR